jgi:hypothetical protein
MSSGARFVMWALAVTLSACAAESSHAGPARTPKPAPRVEAASTRPATVAVRPGAMSESGGPEPAAASSTTIPTATPGAAGDVTGASAARSAPELPRGGRTIFPVHRLVGFCGTPGAPNLGTLAGNLPARAKQIEGYGTKYAAGKTPLPVFELIATLVMGMPGQDGKWRKRVDEHVVDEYLAAARQAKALLLLDLQPGQSDFMTELQHFEKYLHEPDVGVALDPEWAVKAKQKPGVFYGHTTGKVIDDVAKYLSEIVTKDNLPEKVLVYHVLAPFIVSEEAQMAEHPGVVIVKSVDGLGPKGAKLTTYGAVTKGIARFVHPGFKLFFQEDTTNGHKLMTPEEVLRLRPQPDYVMYE